MRKSVGSPSGKLAYLIRGVRAFVKCEGALNTDQNQIDSIVFIEI